MFTRTKDKANKIQYDLNVMSYHNNYTFNTPGNGTTLAYMTSPHIRLQKWGANVRSNMTEIEDDLRGKTRLLNRDDVDENQYDLHNAMSNSLGFESTSIKNQSTKNESNKCEVLDTCLKNTRKDFLYYDPQKNIRYVAPTSTRYVEKWERGIINVVN
tara:strand:+ start:1860 stop:2330 length:471 start_codon:yes stop_codon:yes gene_type:complete